MPFRQALVYLDAASGYAFYDTTAGDIRLDAKELQQKVAALQRAPSRVAIDELLGTVLPRFERGLRELREMDPADSPAPPPRPDYQDLGSFAALRGWRERTDGFSVPIAELRQQYQEFPNGGVGPTIQSPDDLRWVAQQIIGGQQKYVSVSAPVLVFVAIPRTAGRFADPASEARFTARQSAYRTQQAATVRRAAPTARVVDVPGADHYVFLSHKADVVREIHSFLTSLPRASR